MYHTKCNHEVVADLSQSMAISAGIAIGKQSMKVTWISIEMPPVSVIKDIKLYCKNCEEKVTASDLYHFCMDCGQQALVSNMMIIDGSIYCPSCIKLHHAGEKALPLASVLDRLYVGRN
jgi:hypothetical protein